jgi:sensor histidine kinase YesM
MARASFFLLFVMVTIVVYQLPWIVQTSLNQDWYHVSPFSIPVIVILIALSFSEQKTEFIRQISESELARMQHQIKPHFIFNALNTIIWFSKRDQEKTVLLLESCG